MSKVEHDTKQLNLQRGLVIGIGGCGAEVVKRLRRLLIDRFGRFEDIPIVRFFYIDTDPDWLREMTSEVEKEIQLPDTEQHNAQFADATSLYNGMLDGSYPHYDWFTIEKLQHHKSVTRGAGTIRQLGRLCFWHHVADIRKKMSKLLLDLNADQNARFMQEKYGIAIDPGITVHLVAGLAGGTGSGMFLDVAYLARRVLEALNIPGAHQVVGNLILPGAFRELGGANAIPNGYAALKELSYYSYMFAPDNKLAALYGQPVWEADYTGRETDRVRFEGRGPFDFCYLLENRNEHVQLNRSDVFAMIARSLFHEFTLSFAGFKRSLRANIKHRIVSNDKLDCPRGFMSFGQAAAFVPRQEIKSILRNQLALRAVQQWIDKAAKPIEVVAVPEEGQNGEQVEEAAVESLKVQAEVPETVNAVCSFLIKDLIPALGLKAKDVLAGIMSQEKERLTDIPYSLREAEKQRWIAEEWPHDKFEGMVSDAWRRWKIDFGDDGPNSMAWGEKMRRLVSSREKAEKTYRKRLYTQIFDMFEETEKHGPAWAICTAQQLKPALEKLKEVFLKEANDPVAIATLLGDVYLINSAAGGQGPSLSAIIEQRIGKEFGELDKAVKGFNPIGKRERVQREAYEYLTWCAHWCRARIEERARRLSAELVGGLISALSDLERELYEYAHLLARLQSELLKKAREYSQKAIGTENIGELLYNQILLKAMETSIAARQGDLYDPASVAQGALTKAGKKLRDFRQDDMPQLLAALLDAAGEAIGDLDETTLQDTHFAAHDLLSAQYRSDNELDQKLRQTIQSGAPFVMLNPSPYGGAWVPGSDLLEIQGAGMRGGAVPVDQDQDRDRVRVKESLKRVGWDISNAVQPIDDSSQVVFFQECGGFPLRVLAGVGEMKEAYDAHRRQGGTPLHILRDEMAERYPDIHSPREKDLERALTLQSVGISLGFIAPRAFRNPDGSEGTTAVYSYLRKIRELNEEKPVPIGQSVESVGLKLAYDNELATEIEQAVDAAMACADSAKKAEYAKKLKQHLDDLKERLRLQAVGADVQSMPAYEREMERILGFMRAHGLSVESPDRS
jgi:hypothetical protein